MIIVLKKKPKSFLSTTGGVFSRIVEGKALLYTEDGVIRERRVGESFLYSSPQPMKWEHPWFTRVFWSETLKDRNGASIPGFAAVVKPGFINGLDPVCPAAEEVELYSAKGEAKRKGAPCLMDEPLIPLNGNESWEAVQAMPFRVRRYFESIGLSASSNMSVVSGGGAVPTLVVNDTNNQTGISSPKLFQTDLYLAVARPTLVTQQIASGDGMGAMLYDYTVSLDNTIARQFPKPRLLVGKNPRSAGNAKDKLSAGSATRGDEGLDYIGIATIYASAPKDWEAPEDVKRTVPDEKWTIFISYECFWNLSYRSRELQPVTLKSLKVGPIAGGLAGSLIAPAVASANMLLNTGNSLMADALNSQTNEGEYWSV